MERTSLHLYESGNSVPSKDSMANIVRVLGFPDDFFLAGDLEEPSLDCGSFRSMARMKAGQRDMALSQAAFGIELGTWLSSQFELPNPQLPDLRLESDPEAAAEIVRSEWSLGSLSIRNMVHLLESKGIRVFSLAIDAREVDAFSMWSGYVPFVFLNARKTPEHSRYDAAHELAHLVMHRGAPPRGLEAERQANAFASAFLMPEGSIRASAPRFPTYSGLVSLKKTWVVSVGALAYRLHALGLMTDWQYRGICIDISKRGREVEPEESPRESSLLLPKMFAALHAEGISRAQVAREIHLPLEELEELLFGITLAGIEGGGGARSGSAETNRSRLTLVKQK